MPQRDFLASFIQPSASVISPGQRHVPLRIQTHGGRGSLRLKVIRTAVSHSRHSLDDGHLNHTENSNNIQNRGLARVREVRRWTGDTLHPATMPRGVYPNSVWSQSPADLQCCSAPEWKLSPVRIKLTVLQHLLYQEATIFYKLGVDSTVFIRFSFSL